MNATAPVRPLIAIALGCLSLLWLALPQPASAEVTYRGSFGELGYGPGELEGPERIAIDSAGSVYVTDAHMQRQIEVYDRDGAYLRTIGKKGTADDEFDVPNGIAIDGSDNLYVTDPNLDRVQVFGPEGTLLRKFGTPGTGDGEFHNPHGIAVDSEGRMYVLDTFSHRVQVFAADGTFIRKFGAYGTGPVQFKFPEDLVLTPSGNLLITDTSNGRIQEVTPTGEFVRQFGIRGDGPGELQYPAGIDTDAAGNVFVSDGNADRVIEFDPTGNVIQTLDTTDATDGPLYMPSDVTVSDSGDVLVVDRANYRIARFAIVPETTIDSAPGATVTDGAASFTYSSDERGARFECSLDGGAFVACPRGAHGVAGLGNGEHTFAVRGVYGDHADATPATAEFTVELPVQPEDPADDDEPAPRDTAVSSPFASAQAKQLQRGNRIAIRVLAGAGERVSVTATGLVIAGGAEIPLLGLSGEAAAGSQLALQMSPASRKGSRKLTRLLAAGKRPKATVDVTLRDGAGNEERRSVTVTLKAARRR